MRYIDKDEVLSKISEEEIFEMVFGYIPSEYVKVVSPFRQDNNPGCWFEYSGKQGELRFKDHANTCYYNRINMRNIGCFDAVQVYYKLPDFYSTLKFIVAYIDTKKHLKVERKFTKKVTKTIKSKNRIFFTKKEYNMSDAKYWNQYHIKASQLIEDDVFAASHFVIIKKNSTDVVGKFFDIAYAYSFPSGNVKIYQPYNKDFKFFPSNVNNNDIGGLKNLIKSRNLVITKSYKDYRVIKNNGYNVIWFQNEGMLPSFEILSEIIPHYKSVAILFDNDCHGIKYSEIVRDKLRILFPSKNIFYKHLPVKLLEKNIKDYADLNKYNKRYLTHFLSTIF